MILFGSGLDSNLQVPVVQLRKVAAVRGLVNSQVCSGAVRRVHLERQAMMRGPVRWWVMDRAGHVGWDVAHRVGDACPANPDAAVAAARTGVALAAGSG